MERNRNFSDATVNPAHTWALSVQFGKTLATMLDAGATTGQAIANLCAMCDNDPAIVSLTPNFQHLSDEIVIKSIETGKTCLEAYNEHLKRYR